MRYKAEIWHQGRAIDSRTYDKAVNPKQVVRRIVTSNSQPSDFTVYVMNEYGDLWVYNVENRGGFRAVLRRHLRAYFNRDEIHDIFSGNVTIQGAKK